MNDRARSLIPWTLCAGAAAAIAAAAVVDWLDGGWAPAVAGFAVLSIVAFPVPGALLASRRPENAIGWIFCAIGLDWGLAVLVSEYSSYALLHHDPPLPGGGVASWIGVWIWPPGVTLLLTFLLLLFPTGRLPSRRWRLVAWLSGIAMVIQAVPIAIAAWPIQGPLLVNIAEDAPRAAPHSFQVAFDLQVLGILMVFALGLASAVSLVLRFRRARGDERAQIKWFAFAGVTVVLAAILSSPLFNIGGGWALLSVLFLPIATSIAVLKYRLYDIDVVINKTVVFGLLAGFITVVYAGIVVGIGALVGGTGDVVLSAVAAAVVALAFQPIRRRAQRLANRVVYGRRATPYEVLAEFSGRMGDAYATEDVLPRMAMILGEGTGAARADVWLRVGRELRPAGVWPAGGEPGPPLPLAGDDLPRFAGTSAAVPVRHQAELLGALTVTKPPNDPLAPAEEKLVHDLASQAGLVLRNVALIADLRASRQRLVAAQDQERRRIERNIHDGAQQQLVALAVKQRMAASFIGRDDDRVRAILEELQSETNEALEDLRDLARGVYPPLLADQGLAAALEAQARKSAVPVDVIADGIGRFPEEIEAAVYFSCLEALQNVAKYAVASAAVIRLANVGGKLTFEVEDDGVGFDVSSTGYGTGLQGMTDRLDALGGRIDVRSVRGSGTTITGVVPVAAARPPPD